MHPGNSDAGRSAYDSGARFGVVVYRGEHVARAGEDIVLIPATHLV